EDWTWKARSPGPADTLLRVVQEASAGCRSGYRDPECNLAVDPLGLRSSYTNIGSDRTPSRPWVGAPEWPPDFSAGEETRRHRHLKTQHTSPWRAGCRRCATRIFPGSADLRGLNSAFGRGPPPHAFAPSLCWNRT